MTVKLLTELLEELKANKDSKVYMICPSMDIFEVKPYVDAFGDLILVAKDKVNGTKISDTKSTDENTK